MWKFAVFVANVQTRVIDCENTLHTYTHPLYQPLVSQLFSLWQIYMQTRCCRYCTHRRKETVGRTLFTFHCVYAHPQKHKHTKCWWCTTPGVWSPQALWQSKLLGVCLTASFTGWWSVSRPFCDCPVCDCLPLSFQGGTRVWIMYLRSSIPASTRCFKLRYHP